MSGRHDGAALGWLRLKMGMRRVAWLTSGFSPYRVPLWNALCDIVPTKVFLLSEQEKIRQWKRDDSALRVGLESIPGKQIYIGRLDWSLNVSYFSVHRRLSAYDPDALVIDGYESPGYWAGLRWARRHSITSVMHSGTTNLSSVMGGVSLFDFVKTQFVKRFDAYYTYGKYAAEYLVGHGANESRIVIGQNLSDTTMTATCDRLSGRPNPSLLYVGQLIPRKGVLEMLQALSGLKDISWDCTIVGSGPLQPQIDSEIKSHGLEARVTLAGSRDAVETALLYRQHDILVMPSLREVWGLVTNEALLSGLFVVGSNHAASCMELIQEGINGVLVDPTPAGIREGLRCALTMPLPKRTQIRQTAMHISAEGEAGKLWRALQLAEQVHRKG